MQRRLLNIQYFSAVLILSFISLPAIIALLSFINGSSYEMLINRYNEIETSRLFEVLLLITIITQLCTCIRLSNEWRSERLASWQCIRLFAGFYLSVFLLIHVLAVLSARYVLGYKTGFYSGVTGMNTYPLEIVFLIYGALLTVFFGAKFVSRSYRDSFMSSVAVNGIKEGVLLISIIIISLVFSVSYDNRNSNHTATHTLIKLRVQQKT